MILVTGGSGLIGTHLLIQLTAENVKIRAVYRDSNKLIQARKVFEFYLNSGAEEAWNKIEWVQCDILDLVGLKDAFQGVQFVYHCAALVSYQRADFSKLIRINRQGTANMVNLSLEAKVHKFLHVSSTAVFTSPEDGSLINEQTKWKDSTENSGYSISKYSAEKEVWRGIEEGLNAVIINPSVVIGAGNWDESSLTIFRTVAKGFPFYTKGGNAFVDARDLANCMVLLQKSDALGERFLCTGTNLSFRTLFTKIAQELQVSPPNYFANPFLSGIAWRISVFLNALGWKQSLNKDTASTAQRISLYDSSKIQKKFNFQFRTIDDSISNAVKGKFSK